MSGRDRWAWYQFPRSSPRPVAGGIKARSERGSFAATWWGKRWIEVLEGFGWANRLQRGRRYARLGQVLDFRLRPGCVEASVQGSRPRPYRVRILLSPLPEAAWKKVMTTLSLRASFTSELLAGEMPRELEDAFQRSGVGLFPKRDDEFRAECDCPDWANPCKHIAALHYIVGEAFDRDPFLLLTLRGKPRERFLAELRSARTGDPSIGAGPSAQHPGAKARTSQGPHPTASPPSESPYAEAASFWGTASAPTVTSATLPASGSWESGNRPGPKLPHTLLRALGTPAVLRGRDDLVGQLEGAYEVVSRRAVEIMLPSAGPSAATHPGARKPKGSG